MGEYDDILNIIAAEKTTVEEFKTKFTLSARTHIPRLENALKKEGLEKDEIKDRILKDCLQFWTRQTIMNALGDEYKDSVMQEQGRKGGEKRHEIVIDNTGNVGNSQNNDESPSLNIQAKNTTNDDKVSKIKETMKEIGIDTESVEDLQIKLNDMQTTLENEKNERLQFQKLLDREREKVKELESITTTSASHFTPASELSKKEEEDEDSSVIRSTYKKIIGDLNTRILELKDKLVTKNYKETIEIRGQAIVVNIKCSNLESIEVDEFASRKLNQ